VSVGLEAGTGVSVDRRPALRPLTGISWGERLFDLTLIVVVMPVILLLAAAIAVAISVSSPGPVIYRARRIGRNGAPFEMLKFRKMRRMVGDDPLTLVDDERFTTIGRFLAVTRLDELPQAWNVLRGSMRLVGPRPESGFFVDQFPVQFTEILTVRPGVTGRSQLRYVHERHLLAGPDPDRTYSEVILPAKIAIDLHYVRTHSMGGDLWVIALTAAMPLALLGAALSDRTSRLRGWCPTGAVAVILALALVVVSTQVP
jgi:lipopolysaccharide/colanic/teichoic acid biosynthesis glycosyltransferase